MLTALLTLMTTTSGGPLQVGPLGFDPLTQALHLEANAEANTAHATIPFVKGRPRADSVQWVFEEATRDERWLTCDALSPQDVRLAGKLVTHAMKPHRNSLHATFTVDVDLRWRSAKKIVRLTGWVEPMVTLSGVWSIPTTDCILVTLAMRGVPYEGGYFEDAAHVVCETRR